MPTINISNPINLVLLLAATVLLIFLGKETKKSLIPQIVLFVYVILLVLHVIQLMGMGPEDAELISTLYKCITFDFLFILMSFISYLWVDDMEARLKKKKSIDNSLDWFWKKI